MSKTQQAAIDDMVAGLATEQSPDWTLRQRLALGCRILGMQGHGSGLSGQFTARGPEPETMWTLPYGLGFEQVKASDYMLVDRDLKVIEGKGMPNMANRFHIHVYRVRPDVQSIVHTHPPYSSALSMIGEPLKVSHMDTTMFYEDVAFLPTWPGVPFGDEEGEIISEAIGDKNAILLAHHGQLCVGPTVEAACIMGIFFEHAARIQLAAMAAGEIKEIDPELGRIAHDWRHKPEAMNVTFRYFARTILESQSDAVLT